MFDLQKINKRLSKLKATLEFQNQLGSTNDHAADLLRRRYPVPLLVLCESQIAGRGQRGKTWFSGAGSLTLTWCCPAAEVIPPAAISLIAGLVVAEVVCLFCPAVDVKLKWPNDVLVFDDRGQPKKLAGVLVESLSIDGQRYLVIGVGVNVNNSLPNDLVRQCKDQGMIGPVSLAHATGQVFDLTAWVIEIVSGLDHALTANAEGEIWQARYQRLLAFRGEPVAIIESTAAGPVNGTLESVAADGSLVLRSENELRQVYTGSLRPL